MKTIQINGILVKKNVLKCSICINGNNETITVDVTEKLQSYLTTDRIDFVVVGLLCFAINHGYDFESHLPITEDLYYNLNTQLIDILAINPGGHRTRINAPVISAIQERGEIVATGISCGVDCFYTIATHSGRNVPKANRITDLCFFDVGSHETGKSDGSSRALYEGRLSLCKHFAEENNYGFLSINNDIYKVIDKYAAGGYSHLENHTFMALACIYAVQKGFSKYYYSAGYSYAEFHCSKNKKDNQLDSAYYDLLTLTACSVTGLQFSSIGASLDRLEKTKVVADYKPAFNYLNVCVNTVKNDSKCFKCVRTMLTLNVLGKLENFNNVFDVEYFKSHLSDSLGQLYIEAVWYHDDYMIPLYQLYAKELTIALKIKAVTKKFFGAIYRRLKR